MYYLTLYFLEKNIIKRICFAFALLTFVHRETKMLQLILQIIVTAKRES